MLRPGALLLIGVLLVPAVASGQQTDLRKQIEESQRRLEAIKAERSRLQTEIEQVRVHMQDASSELENVERRLSQSRSILAEVNLQSDALSKEVASTTADLLQTRERLAESKAILDRRMRDIYKMGPLHTMQVLLGATSFTDLLNRYRYLQRIASFDKALVARVSGLESDLVTESNALHSRMVALESVKQTRQGEVSRLRSVESERQRTLSSFRSQERKTSSRLDQLAQDQARMTKLVDDLERRRREEEARAQRAGPGAETLSSADEGSLSWPLNGTVIYRFGRQRRPDGTVLRWNGLGISAPVGTPVRAVKAGRVVLAGPFEGYGPTVILSHGGGFYTLYLYLDEIGVVEGRDVAQGQVVGTVGGADTPEGPHIEFQVRAPVSGGSPQAQDPLQWLRDRGRK